MYATTPSGITSREGDDLRWLAEFLCFALESLLVEGGPVARRDAKEALHLAKTPAPIKEDVIDLMQALKDSLAQRKPRS